MIVAAVTEAPRAAPIAKVPAPYVALDQVPTYVTAIVPKVLKLKDVELVMAPDPAAFQEQA